MAKASIPRSPTQAPLASAKAQAYQRIESVLEAAGADGVHGSYFVYALFWPQFRARLNEMNRLGWKIQSVDLPKSAWIRGIRTKYVLLSKPLEVAPGEDWYEKLKVCPRPSTTTSTTDDLPLFDGMVRQ
jgi:hypothetical protein